MGIALLPLLCLLLVAGLLKLLLASGWAARIAMDLPNERSLHAAPIPRIGGIVLVGIALAASAAVAPALRPVLLIAAVLAVVSAWDDRHGLPVALRFAVHLAAAVGTIVVLQLAVPLWLAIGLVLLLTWAMNLYNFMDGSDGLAGGMALFGFGAFGIAALDASPAMAAAGFCISAAAAGFLWHNFHPARVFLGDAGSIPLGFLAGGLSLAGCAQSFASRRCAITRNIAGDPDPGRLVLSRPDRGTLRPVHLRAGRQPQYRDGRQQIRFAPLPTLGQGSATCRQ